MDETYLNIRNGLNISEDLTTALYLYRANVNYKRKNIIKCDENYEYVLEFLDEFPRINLYLFRNSEKLATHRIRLKNKNIYKSIKNNLYDNTSLIVNREKLDDVPTKESTESCIIDFIEKGLKEININSVEELLDKFSKIKNTKKLKELNNPISYLVTILNYKDCINKKPLNLCKNGFMIDIDKRPIIIKKKTDDPKKHFKLTIFPTKTTGFINIETLNLRENDDLKIIKKSLNEVNNLLYGPNKVSKKKIYAQHLKDISTLSKTFKEKGIEKITYKGKTIFETNMYGEIKINLSEDLKRNEKMLKCLTETFTPSLKRKKFYDII